MIAKLIEWLYFKQENNLALYCQHTGLYNRNWFEKVAKRKYKNKDIYITVIDIDGFKSINDKHGHLYGDEVIRHIVYLLRLWFPSPDTIGRYGGDEFIIFTKYNPYIRLDKMNKQINYTFSFGIARKEKSNCLQDIISLADSKMYKNKINKQI